MESFVQGPSLRVAGEAAFCSCSGGLTAIDDMFFRHHTDKLLIPFGLVIVLFVTSYRAKYHLRSEMPAAFFDEDQKSKKSSLDEKIAWAYWESAVMNLQWKYPYSHPLPIAPPGEFQVNAIALGPTASDPATRLLYWRHLQRVWYLPEAWQKDYEWDFSWLGDPVSSGGGWLRNTADRLFTIH